jgi:hypothetical protein
MCCTALITMYSITTPLPPHTCTNPCGTVPLHDYHHTPVPTRLVQYHYTTTATHLYQPLWYSTTTRLPSHTCTNPCGTVPLHNYHHTPVPTPVVQYHYYHYHDYHHTPVPTHVVQYHYTTTTTTHLYQPIWYIPQRNLSDLTLNGTGKMCWIRRLSEYRVTISILEYSPIYTGALNRFQKWFNYITLNFSPV